MKCKYCGAEVDLGQKCEYCGSRAEPMVQKLYMPEEKKKEYITVNGIYTVQEGDSLWKIVKALYGSCSLGSGSKIREIVEKNKLKGPNFIYPGQKLKI